MNDYLGILNHGQSFRAFVVFLVLAWTGICIAGPKVLFLVGETEYQHEECLRALAEGPLSKAGFDCEFIAAGVEDKKWNQPARNEFPGVIEALKNSDVLVVATWRRQPRKEVVRALQEWVDSGKPVMGVRTASHAFSKRSNWKVPAGHGTWEEFDRDVFGADYNGHYANLKNRENQTLLFPLEETAKSSLFQGVAFKKVTGADTSLYRMEKPDAFVNVLIKGIAAGMPSSEQLVFWTREELGKKSVFTTLGGKEDFDKLEWLTPLYVNSIKWLAKGENE